MQGRSSFLILALVILRHAAVDIPDHNWYHSRRFEKITKTKENSLVACCVFSGLATERNIYPRKEMRLESLYSSFERNCVRIAGGELSEKLGGDVRLTS